MKLLVLTFLTLLGVSFAQNESAGLSFTDFLNNQAEIPSSAASPPAISVPPAASYESFLATIEAYANFMLPEKKRLETSKAAVNSETTSPRDEFEKQVDYEKRLADFEKAKQQKILALEQDYQTRTKETMAKLKAALTSKEDLQPDWAGMLKKDAGIEEYRERINKLTYKISEMKGRISKINASLNELKFSKSDTEALLKRWQEKNLLYISRLERACELMQDYIIQEQVKVLSTDRKKFETSLGTYNADKEEFELDMNDASSQTVPFDYSGTVKISPQQAKETNRQTDNFTASVDYINYPFMVDGAKLYPGAKKAHIFYKEQELPTNGIFKRVPSLDNLDGYPEWLAYADSLLSGKLSPKNLDSLYAMKAVSIKVASETKQGDGFWTGKNIFRVAMFSFCAAGLGLGILQDGDVKSKNDTKNERYLEAYYAQNAPDYPEKRDAYDKSRKALDKSVNLRSGFYIGAGVFGLAGAASFFF